MEGGAVAPGLPGDKDFRRFSKFGKKIPGSILVEFLWLDLGRVFAPSIWMNLSIPGGRHRSGFAGRVILFENDKALRGFPFNDKSFRASISADLL